MKKYFIHTVLFALPFLFGCSGSEQMTQQTPPAVSTEKKQSTPTSQDRNESMRHFIAGSTFDTKGQYADAALEYQEALRFDDDPAIYYALSSDYFRLKKGELALTNAIEAVVRDSNNRDYREHLGEIYFSQFKLDSALAQFNNVIRIDSEYVNGWYNLARVQQFRTPSVALATYNTMMQRFGAQWEILEQIAGISMSLRKFEEAAEAFSDMLSLDPSNPELEHTLASTYELAGNDSLAALLYKKISEETDNIDAKIAYARFLLVQHKFAESDSLINPIINADTASFDTKLKVGESYINALEKDSTLFHFVYAYFIKLKEFAPADWRPYWFLAALDASEKHYDDAAAHYAKLIAIDPSREDAWVNYASVYAEQQKFMQMAEILERARSIFPNEFRINFFLGIAYYRDGKLEQGIDPLERALQVRADDMNTISTLALIYDALKRWEDSDRLYEQALKLEPNNHLILNNYGYSLANRNDQLNRAKELTQRALEQQPKNPSYLDTMGWIFFRLGQYEEAKSYVMQAVETGDVSAEVNEHLGDIYFKMNDKQKALDYWKKAVDIDQNRETAKEKIRKGSL